MSTVVAVAGLTVFYVGWGVAVLVTVAVAVVMWSSRAAVGTPPAVWGTDADDYVWDDEATTAIHGSLTTVRATAKSWGETITALLGVLSAVAFIKGPDAFTDIDGTRGTVAALLIMLAAGLAAAAVALAALAAQGVPQKVAPFDGWALKSLTLTRARRAATQLAWSRLLAVCALLIVVFVAGLTWLAALEQSDSGDGGKAAVVVPSGGGPPRCGTLGSTDEVLTLTRKGGQPQVIAGATSITIVDKCP